MAAAAIAPAELEYELQHINDDRKNPVIALNVALLTLATIAVLLRFLSRKVSRVKLAADDYVIILCLAGCYMYLTTIMLCVRFGAGKHVLAVGVPTVKKFLMAVYASQIVYTFTIPCIKLAIVLLYRRIFPTRGFRIATNCLAIFLGLWCFSSFIGAIFICRPVSFFWNKVDSTDGSCFDYTAFAISEAWLSIATDIVILLMPLPMIWHLQMPMRQKAAISCIFLLGGFVCVASGVRIPTLKGLGSSDPTWTDYGCAIWTQVELCVAVICACLPVMRPLFRSLLGSSVQGHPSDPNSGSSGSSFWRRKLRSQSNTSRSERLESKASSGHTPSTPSISRPHPVQPWEYPTKSEVSQHYQTSISTNLNQPSITAGRDVEQGINVQRDLHWYEQQHARK